MQHEIQSSKANGLRSEECLNESIEIFRSVSGQDMQKVWEQQSPSVLIVKDSIWEWQYDSIFLPGKHQVSLQRITSKGSGRFCYWGFHLWGPSLFSKNWIETMDLLHVKSSGIWNVDAFEIPSLKACFKYFVVEKKNTADSNPAFGNSLFPSNLHRY